MDGPVYLYFVSFTYNWRGRHSGNLEKGKFGNLPIAMPKPVTTFADAVEMQDQASEIVDQESIDYDVVDLIVLHYVLLRFAPPRTRTVSSAARASRSRTPRARRH